MFWTRKLKHVIGFCVCAIWFLALAALLMKRPALLFGILPLLLVMIGYVFVTRLKNAGEEK